MEKVKFLQNIIHNCVDNNVLKKQIISKSATFDTQDRDLKNKVYEFFKTNNKYSVHYYNKGKPEKLVKVLSQFLNIDILWISSDSEEIFIECHNSLGTLEINEAEKLIDFTTEQETTEVS